MAGQELHSDQSQFRTRTGTTLKELAEQCRERYFLSQGVPKDDIPEWADLPEDAVSRWLDSTKEVADEVSHEIKTTFSRLARRFAATYHAQDVWDTYAASRKLGYEVVVRHVVNMVASEDSDDTTDALAYNWLGWVKTKERMDDISTKE